MLRSRRSPEFIAKLSGWVRDHNRGNDVPMVSSNVLEEVESSEALSVTQKSQRLLLEAVRGQKKLGERFNINEPRFIAASHSQDKSEVAVLLRVLSDQGLIKTVALGGKTEILPRGYTEAERLEEEAHGPDVEAQPEFDSTDSSASTGSSNTTHAIGAPEFFRTLDVPITQAFRDLFAIAAAYSRAKKSEQGTISSTCFLFAAADGWQGRVITPTVVETATLDATSSVIRESHIEEFETLAVNLFERTDTFQIPDQAGLILNEDGVIDFDAFDFSGIGLSPYLKNTLEYSYRIANETFGDNAVSIAHLLINIFLSPSSNLASQFEDMGIRSSEVASNIARAASFADPINQNLWEDFGNGITAIKAERVDYGDEVSGESLVPVHAWVTSGSPQENRKTRLKERNAGETLRWQVPKSVRKGDYLFMWVTGGPGFHYILRALDDAQPDTISGKAKHSTELNILARFAQPVDMKTLRSNPVLEGWPLVKKNMQGVIARQPDGIEKDPRVWRALTTIIAQRNPDTASLLEKIEADLLPRPAIVQEGQIRVRRDDAERDHDALGRAPLAVSLAWTLHEIWCTEQGLAPFPSRTPHRDAAGFVAHIDAPWGGGKTSFANLIARTLNPELDGKVPEFLKELYPDRTDMSGLFISACHETGKLKDIEARDYRWDSRGRRPWIIVEFNAWQKQHVDPPWWSFYQTIRKACFAAIRKDGVPTVFQELDGRYCTKNENWLDRFDRIRALWLRELWWRFWTPKVRRSVMVLLLVIAAALVLRQFDQFDLKSLQKSISGSDDWSLSTLISTAVTVVLGGASALWSLFAAFTQSLLPGTPEAAKNYSLGSADPFARFRSHFAQMMEQIQRPVLVIIDDVDRCEPQFIVEMTRGLQTILTSPRVVYLLLGDRNWIEQAFEICHKDMKDINVGPEHTFGGRFVEKAIQLSFVLPGIGEHKEDYVREVLTGRAARRQTDSGASGLRAAAGTADEHTIPAQKPTELDQDGTVDISAEERQALRSRISKADSAQEIDAAGAEAIDSRAGADPGRTRAYQRAVREEVVLRRAAQKEEVEEAIRHRLQPLGRFLPENPRHIKRIINAVSMYQNSILLTEENYGDAEFGGTRWRQLVIGVVLMVGYPKSWSYLAKYPEWTDSLIAEKKSRPDSPNKDAEDDVAYAALKANANFIALLSKTDLLDSSLTDSVKTEIASDVVHWLNRVIPIAAG